MAASTSASLRTAALREGEVLRREWIHIAAVCVAVAKRMLSDALRYATERRQFGQPIAILVPADAPVALRGVSADVVHGFLIQGTNPNGLKGI